MDRYGLIGYPIGHSFSQKYFTEKFKNENIDSRYDLFPIENIDNLPELMDSIEGLRGLNVTIPHKQAVMRFLDELDDEAREIGAVNVVKVSEKGGKRWLKGYNSDMYGFRESIKPLLNETHRKALVLGTGGASKAVVYTLNKLGVRPTLVSRKSSEGVLTYSELTTNVLKEYTVIVNASPVGMSPNVDLCPNIPYDGITAEHVCYDLIYNPEETLFLKKAKAQGAVVKNGLEMLHLQAEGAWKIWSEK